MNWGVLINTEFGKYNRKAYGWEIHTRNLSICWNQAGFSLAECKIEIIPLDNMWHECDSIRSLSSLHPVSPTQWEPLQCEGMWGKVARDVTPTYNPSHKWRNRKSTKSNKVEIKRSKWVEKWPSSAGRTLLYGWGGARLMALDDSLTTTIDRSTIDYLAELCVLLVWLSTAYFNYGMVNIPSESDFHCV